MDDPYIVLTTVKNLMPAGAISLAFASTHSSKACLVQQQLALLDLTPCLSPCADRRRMS